MPIDNLNSLEANKQDYPEIIPPDDPTYYLSSAEWNKLIQTLKILINDYNANVANLGGGVSLPLITSTDTITEPTDSNIFSAARTLSEILSVLSGYDDYYLSKRFNDVSTGKITFNKGLQLGTYEPNIRGGNIDQGGNAELNSLRLRQWLEVPELRYNRVEIQMGDKWRSPGGGIIESVDTVNKIATLKLEDGEYGAIAVNDLCIGIFHSMINSNNATSNTDDSKNNRTIKGFATAYFKVTELLNPNGNNNRFRYELRPISTNFTKQVEPEPFMNFAVFGNTTDTDRQSSAYETRTYQRFLINMNTWESTRFNIAAQFGDLTNLNTLGITEVSGYSIYLNNVYFTGTIQQMKSPRVEYGTWWTWNGYQWVDSGVPATGIPKDGIYATLLNNNLTVVRENPTYEHTWAELHVYEGNQELSYIMTPPVTVNGTYTVNLLPTGLTPGSLVSTTVNNITFLKTTPILSVNPEVNNANLLFNISGKRLDGTVFSFSTNQTFTKVNSGTDGDSVEYVYTRTTTNVAPLRPDSQNIDQYIPIEWTSDPVGPNDTLEYEWVVKRQKINKIWSAWSDPAMWSRHVADGIDGKDGTDIEYIYTINNNQYFSDDANIPPTSQTDDYVPTEWSDEPIGPNPTYKYEWVSQRRKTGGVGGVGGTWSTFSRPALWSVFAEDGGAAESLEVEYSVTGTGNWHAIFDPYQDKYMRQRVGTGTWTSAIRIVGEDGQEGPYTEYQFSKNTSQDTPPNSGWQDGPPSLVEGEYLWMRTRKVVPPNAPEAWSPAVRLNGKPGLPGPPGSGVPIVYRGEYRATTNGQPDGPPVHYYGSTTRIDIVKYNNYYYKTKETAGDFYGFDPTDATYWDPFGSSFESVATSLLLAENANIASFVFRDLTMQSQMGINSTGSEINLGTMESIPNDLDFIPNLKLDGVNGNISIRDKIKFFGDGSGYFANNNLRWDNTGNLLIGESPLGIDGNTGGTLEIEFSVSGKGNWHTNYFSGDNYIRKRVNGGVWTDALKIVNELGTEVDAIYTDYQFANNINTSNPNIPPSAPASDSTSWSDTPIALNTAGQHMWMRYRSATCTEETPTYTYGNWSTPSRITGSTGYKTNGIYNAIKFAQDGSGYLANNNLRWDTTGNLSLGVGTTSTKFNTDGSGYLANGKIEWDELGNTTYSGDLKGVNGSFRNLQAADSDGVVDPNVAITLETSSTSPGRLWFKGDLQHQGYDYTNSRSFRFLTSAMWCRGTFGSRERNTAIISGHSINYYTKGLSVESSYSEALTSGITGSDTYYTVPIYGGSGDASGFPVDILLFKSIVSSDLFTLSGAKGGVVKVINLTAITLVIIANGTRVNISPGSYAEFLNVGNHLSDYSSSYVGAGWKKIG